MATVTFQVQAADVLAVDKQFTALEFVEARDQLGNARLARARMPHQRHALPGTDAQAEIGQHLLLFAVAEADIAEFDLPP